MHRERGLTLIELSVTLAVLAICVAVGVPALRAFVQQQRATAAMGSLTAHLAARSNGCRHTPSSRRGLPH
jgi:prepilin-type N-terminal cleavage/methylation domain-containing protein